MIEKKEEVEDLWAPAKAYKEILLSEGTNIQNENIAHE